MRSEYTAPMTTYVALLRGIGPANPNMHPQKLREAFEKMGFTNVRTVIASGNVVFESRSKNASALETKIEAALPKLLGFRSTTIVRSAAEVDALLKKNPVKNRVHGAQHYILVTFLKEHSAKLRTFPRTGDGYTILGVYRRELCISIDREHARTPDVMLRLEKELGKAITSRTWNTVEKIAKKMDSTI